MLYFCLVLFLSHTCRCGKVSDEGNLNDIRSRVSSYEVPKDNGRIENAIKSLGNSRDNTQGDKTVKQKQSDEDEESSFNLSWDNFTASLTEETLQQLEVVRQNIKISYRLSTTDLQEIDKAFNIAANEYLQLIKYNMKNIIDAGQFNKTLDFMIDFVDLSNYVLESTLDLTLANLGGRLLLPTKWYKQSMKQKILRQQSKIATNYVESRLCWKLAVCKDRVFYTQYLTEWIRRFLGFSPIELKKLFLVIPDILSQNMHTIKSTVRFMKTVKYIVNNDDIVQRDTLDYVDEVITAPKNVQNLVPASLKKGAVLLRELFQLIDSNYDINDNNEEQLENVSKLVMEWDKGGIENIKLALENILKNLQINLKIWPLAVQNQIDIIWAQIITL